MFDRSDIDHLASWITIAGAAIWLAGRPIVRRIASDFAMPAVLMAIVPMLFVNLGYMVHETIEAALIIGRVQGHIEAREPIIQQWLRDYRDEQRAKKAI
jgi:hypothetical protein